jgi:hypothetical protein
MGFLLFTEDSMEKDLRHTKLMAQIELKKKELDAELELKRTENQIKSLEAESTAKDVASKYIGKSAVPWIVFLVIVGVVSSAFIDASALPAVIGLVSTATMALITMVAGITGAKDDNEEERTIGTTKRGRKAGRRKLKK